MSPSRTSKFFLTISLIIVLITATNCGGPAPVPTSLSPSATAPLLPGSPTPPPSASPTPPPPSPTPTPRVPIFDNGAPLPPQLLARGPNGGREVPVSAPIELTFDQPMNPAKTDPALSVTDITGAKVNGKVSWPKDYLLRFTPDSPLKPGTSYLVSLAATAASASGVELTDSLHLPFETTGALAISQVFPAKGTSDVANTSIITVIFNRPVVPLVTAEEQSKLPNPLIITPEIPGKGEWINTSVYVFRPEKYLKGATIYTVLVKAGLVDATGDEGSKLAEDYTWSFSTIAPSLGALWLSDWITNPENNYANVPLEQYFRLTFMQPMDHGSTEAALSIVSQTGEAVSLITTWDNDDTRLVFTPTHRLALGTQYTLNLDGKQALAADGGALQSGLNWIFTTLLPPGIVSTYPANGEPPQRTFEGRFNIQFASPMSVTTIINHIEFTPKVDNLTWFYNSWNWSIDFYGLQSSTAYTVKMLPGMQDLYGNTMTSGQTARFTTGVRPPSAFLQMPYDSASIYRLGGPQNFYVRFVNINSLDLKLYHTTLDKFIAGYSSLPPTESQLVWQKHLASNAGQNERILKSFTFDQNGDPLPPGLYFLGMDADPVPHPYSDFLDQRILIIADANLTLKSSPDTLTAWLTDLTTGQPLADVLITFYEYNNNALTPIGQATTNADGLAALKLDYNPANSWDPTRLAVVDSGGHYALANTDWGSGTNPYDLGIWQDYYSYPNQPTAYIYTERPLYRPGQPVYFKGILRLNNDLQYNLPQKSSVFVKIVNYEGTSVYEQELPLSDMGTFNGELMLATDTTLGAYSVSVSYPDTRDQYLGYLGFNVAEYRKPEFQVTVAAEPQNVLTGDTFRATIKADYYSGGSVANANVYWTLTAAPFYFQPPDQFTAYSFDDYAWDTGWRYGDTSGSGTEVVAQGNAQTGDNGELVLDLPANLGDSATGKDLTLEATVTDVSGAVVSGRASLVAHHAKVYPGVKAKDYVATVGQETAFDLVTLDWNGAPLPSQQVDVSIVERRWYSVQEQDPQGYIRWTWSVQDVPVVTLTAVTMDDKGLATIKFTPPKGGVYRALVTARDDKGNLARASAYLWVAGEDYVPWRQTNDRSFQLITDKTTYSPGDTAEILIASPFQGDTYALVTVERGRIHQQEVIHLTTNSTIYHLPITPVMAPNAYISVLIVKGIDDTNPRPDFRLGLSEIKVTTDFQALQVEITPDKSQAGPGETVNYTVRVTDQQGQPVPAEVSLSLSDLATLSLADPNSAPILNFFYSRRDLGVRTAVPIVLNIEDYNATIRDQASPEGAGMGAGGGKGDGAFGIIEVRQDFPDTAYWKADVQTDANGEATVSITLPDNLTTWRMDARAVTADTRVGQATQNLISTKPLLVRPQTPRFFVAGDEAILGTALHNNTGQPLTVQVALEASGLVIQSEAIQTVDIAAGRQAYVTWQVSIPLDSERVDLIFAAQSGAYQDASRPTLGTLDNQGIPVYRYEAPETVGTSGEMTESGTRIETIALPPGITVTQGSITVQLAPSLAAGMTDGLTYLEHFPYECAEQTISSFLPNVLTTQALKAAGLNNPDLEANLQKQVKIGLQRLSSNQNSDGGWGWWSTNESNPLTSAYVILGLTEAKNAGYSVDASVLSRGVQYLRLQIKPVKQLEEPYKLNQQAFLLYVLARAGAPMQPSQVGQLYDQRQIMGLFARAYLAETLYQIDAQDPRLKTLVSDFAGSAILTATGAHWEEKENDYWNWNTNLRTTAIILGVITKIDPNNGLAPQVVRWLMSNRNNGGYWASTQETAWVLMALTRWMVASGELQADYGFAVALNGERLGEGLANAETLRQTTTLKADVASLLKDGLNRLAFARDGGPGTLYYTAHLNVNLPVDQVSALERGIIVSRAYYPAEGAASATNSPAGLDPVTAATRGDLLLVRVTVVAPHDLHYVVVDDPLPAGLEAVDQSLKTSQQSLNVNSYNWEDMWKNGWGWWYFSHVELRDDRVVLSADFLPAGTYVYTYLVRASTPGTFRVIPTTAQEFYFPEVYGRGDGSLFLVNP